MPPDTRRGLIVEAALGLLAEGDPLLVTFEQVADAAGVSRALVHNYLGDRRGLLDAVQVRVVARLDAWVAHGLSRAMDPEASLAAIVAGTFSFVEAERDAWGVLVSTGGLDHPALHGVRHRWGASLRRSVEDRGLGGDVALAGLLSGVGVWSAGGVDPDEVITLLGRILV